MINIQNLYKKESVRPWKVAELLGPSFSNSLSGVALHPTEVADLDGPSLFAEFRSKVVVYAIASGSTTQTTFDFQICYTRESNLSKYH